MAFLILPIISAGIVSILWTLFACSAIFFINSASVGAVVWNLQSIPISLHANVGIVVHRTHLSFIKYLLFFLKNKICKYWYNYSFKKCPAGMKVGLLLYFLKIEHMNKYH